MKNNIIKYFQQVEVYKIIILNVILSIIASYPVMLASLFIFGLFVKPTIMERLIGFIILVSTALLIVFFNYLLYKIDKKKAKNKKIKSNIIITLLIIILLAGSFFIFPNIWLNIWGFIF
jgi:hypothetical protein